MSVASPRASARPRWGSRHPRWVAFIVFAIAYTCVALVLTYFLGNPYAETRETWGPAWLGFEPFAILGGVLAIPFFGTWVHDRDHHTRNQSVFRGCVVGFLLIPVTVLAHTVWNLLSDEVTRQDAMGMIHSRDITMALEMSFLSMMFAMLYSLLLPEMLGALAGYVTWRMARSGRG